MSNHIVPYKGSSDLLNHIPTDAQLLVIGTSPGGCDVARLASAAGLKRVTLVSRNGRLPKVQPFKRDLSLETEVETRIRSLEARAQLQPTGKISLSEVLNEFLDLVNAIAPDFSWEEFLNASPDAIQELENDVQVARRSGANWQKIMLPLGVRTPRIWRLLSDEDRHQFRQKYESCWITHRHGMPLRTAEQILEMLKSGFMRIGALRGTVSERAGIFSVPVCLRPGELQIVEATHVVVATGPNYQCTSESENPLIREIARSGFTESHPLGGFNLEPNSFRLKGRPRVYCIGAMTRGVEFYINAMPVLLQQSTEIVHDLFRRLR